MLRAKRLTPIAAFTNSDVSLPGIGDIPSITKTVPNVKVGAVNFGIWAPKGIPDEVVKTMTKIWNDKIKNSERLKKYVASKGLGMTVMSGDAAYKQAFPTTRINAWQIHKGGKSKVSPDTVGIPKP
jgi:tripartite-type tricarboxylate transporter receptor subunit TctC